MCLAYPGKILKISGRSATVLYPSGAKDVLLGEENIKVGDMVLVQMGIVIKKISPKESKIISEAWNEKMVDL